MSQCARLLDRLERGPITPMEAWKDASEIDQRLDGYAISSYGRIKSLERKVNHHRGGLKIVHERILKAGRKPNGYSNICLGDRGTYLIHRLVALAFVKNEFNKPCVNHIDGDKNNNRGGSANPDIELSEISASMGDGNRLPRSRSNEKTPP